MTASHGHYQRSADRAKAVLKQGDKVRMIGHGAGGSGRVSYLFDHWDEHSPSGEYFVSKSGIDELHPYNIERVNGVPVSFRDPA